MKQEAGIYVQQQMCLGCVGCSAGVVGVAYGVVVVFVVVGGGVAYDVVVVFGGGAVGAVVFSGVV